MAKRTFRWVHLTDVYDRLDLKNRRDDTSAIVLIHCWLDNVLESVLRRVLHRDKHVFAMFAPKGALWSFYTKVEVCYALGLVSRSQRADLMLANSIRNRAAHRIAGRTFKAGDIDKLFWETSGGKAFRGAIDEDPQTFTKYLHTKKKLVYAVTLLKLGYDIDRRWSIARLRRAPEAKERVRELRWPRTQRKRETS